MKKAIIYIALILTPLNLWSQDIIPDSIEYIRQCDCEKSILKFKDWDRKEYHVFFDFERGEFFLLRKQKNYFRREKVEWCSE